MAKIKNAPAPKNNANQIDDEKLKLCKSIEEQAFDGLETALGFIDDLAGPTVRASEFLDAEGNVRESNDTYIYGHLQDNGEEKLFEVEVEGQLQKWSLVDLVKDSISMLKEITQHGYTSYFKTDLTAIDNTGKEKTFKGARLISVSEKTGSLIFVLPNTMTIKATANAGFSRREKREVVKAQPVAEEEVTA